MHTFHVVPDEFNIPSDAIIGKDFNKRFNVLIDYGNMTFTIRAHSDNIVIKILGEPKENTAALPARCECFRVFHIENFTGPCIIPNQEIAPGVLIPNTIIFEQNPTIRVLNTNINMTTVPNNIEKTEPLAEYDIYTTKSNKNSTFDHDRWRKISEHFSKTPKHVRNELLDLCKNYTDVFALSDDPMTVNNFYEQKLKLKSDNPVYIKNYRLPKTQKDEIDKQVSKLLKNNLVEPSISAFNSPLILVPKKKHGWHKTMENVCRLPHA